MRNARFHALLLIGALGCADSVAAPEPDPRPGPPPRWMSATAEGEPWNAFLVSVWRDGDMVVFMGEHWPSGETTLRIRLYVRVDVGLGPQVIGASSITAADVVYDPMYTPAQAWTASGANGSGTVTLETLTNDRATGTFSFTAAAVTAATNPATYRVTNGSFDIRF